MYSTRKFFQCSFSLEILKLDILNSQAQRENDVPAFRTALTLVIMYDFVLTKIYLLFLWWYSFFFFPAKWWLGWSWAQLLKWTSQESQSWEQQPKELHRPDVTQLIFRGKLISRKKHYLTFIIWPYHEEDKKRREIWLFVFLNWTWDYFSHSKFVNELLCAVACEFSATSIDWSLLCTLCQSIYRKIAI